MNPTLAIALALFILLILLALILSMFISLGRQGDERRRLIVEKASFGTLSITAIYLLFEIFERMVLVFTGRNLSPGGDQPLYPSHGGIRHLHGKSDLVQKEIR